MLLSDLMHHAYFAIRLARPMPEAKTDRRNLLVKLDVGYYVYENLNYFLTMPSLGLGINYDIAPN